MTSGEHRPHHRPILPGAARFDEIESGTDPAVLTEAAERAAAALVRGGRSVADSALVDRVVHLAETEGLESLAELWSGSPADSLAGSLWRLYLLRSWVYAEPHRAATEFDRGRLRAPVGEAISGMADPPGPDQVRALLDQVLSGVVVGDYADTLFRAAAFARVVAAGRVGSCENPEDSYDTDLSASRLVTLADQLTHAGRLELTGDL